MSAATITNKPTHLLIVCPRGFANERSVYPINAEMLADAEAAVAAHNPEGHVSLTRLVKWSDSVQSDRRDAGKWLHESDSSLLHDTLYTGALAITLYR